MAAARGAGLSKKIGPLPAWGWAVIVLAVVAFFFLRGRSASASGGAIGADPSGLPLDSSASGGASGGGSPNDPNAILATGYGSAPGSTGDAGATATTVQDPGTVTSFAPMSTTTAPAYQPGAQFNYSEPAFDPYAASGVPHDVYVPSSYQVPNQSGTTTTVTQTPLGPTNTPALGNVRTPGAQL